VGPVKESIGLGNEKCAAKQSTGLVAGNDGIFKLISSDMHIVRAGCLFRQSKP
jgi:hypothetical protein